MSPWLASRWLFLATALAAVGLLATPTECARAFFVFGDSLVDSGNNNYLMTSARADAPPYGVDFPTRRPTGRFSNGKNIPDIISTLPSPHSALLATAFACRVSFLCSLDRSGFKQSINAGEHLGSEPPMPYLSPQLRGKKLLVGANFASAGVGILNDTGIQFVSVSPFVPILCALFV